MARSLQQVMAELDPYYAGSKTAVQTQLDAAPVQQEAELSGLDAKLGQANDNILSAARSRGLGFSGIPVAEQAKYAATDYAPAVANLKGKYVTQKNTLTEALNSLGRDQMTQGQSIFDAEQQRDLAQQQLNEQKRQFDMQLAESKAQAARAAAASGGGSYSFGGLGGGSGASPAAPAASSAQMQYIPTKGFNFTNGGKGISAYAFSSIKGQDFRNVLSQMAKQGDRNAGVALSLVGSDGYADPSKLRLLTGAQRNGLKALGVRNA